MYIFRRHVTSTDPAENHIFNDVVVIYL